MTASQLLKAYLENVRDVRKAAGLFAEDDALELPYLDLPGTPTRPEEIRKFLETFCQFFQNYSVKMFIKQPDLAFGKCEFTTQCEKLVGTSINCTWGRPVASAGKIKLLREALDTVSTLKAFASNGG